MATEVKQRNPRVLVVVGAVLALATFALVFYLSRGNSGTSSSGSTVPVVVAKVDLIQGTQLTTDNVTTVSLPQSSVPKDAFQSAPLVVNKFVAVSVSANTPITQGLLIVDKNQITGAALTVQPLSLTKNYVAMAIPAAPYNPSGGNAAELSTIGYFIQPEDHIDILMTANGAIRYAFQDVRVIKVGTYANQAAATSTPTVYIVELPRAQAETMAFLLDKKLKADGSEDKTAPYVERYVLRPRDEYGKTGQPANYEDAGDPKVKQSQDTPVNAQVFDSVFGVH